MSAAYKDYPSYLDHQHFVSVYNPHRPLPHEAYDIYTAANPQLSTTIASIAIVALLVIFLATTIMFIARNSH